MSAPLLQAMNLSRSFSHKGKTVAALKNISLAVSAGEILGVVGESGSGKSTLARILAALDAPNNGQVIFENADLFSLPAKALRAQRLNFQMIFQDPYSSLNPRHRIGRIVAEPLHLEAKVTKHEAKLRVEKALEDVGLSAGDVNKFPHEFSGGQRQRIAIARALITRPKLIIADEATSALDISVQAQVLALFRHMRDQYAISVIFITHDIAVVEEICDRVVVMQSGQIVEYGDVDEVLYRPQHVYTQQLLGAEPKLDDI